jgi:hypothetical protein
VICILRIINLQYMGIWAGSRAWGHTGPP